MSIWHPKSHENSLKLLLRDIPDCNWEPCIEMAVGGLTEVAFSRIYPHLLLIISSSGRGVLDCRSGEIIARDHEDYGDWYDSVGLECAGIGPLSSETLSIAGLCGGGLPMYNRYGETLERVSPEWPLEMLIWCPPGKSALIASHKEGCLRLANDYFRCVGFSWDGELILSATSSDITVWKRQG